MAVIESLGYVARDLIDSFGYAGIVLGMAIESFNIPLPSEIIMTFAGSLVATHELNFWLVVLAGGIGNLIGSVANYYLGAKGGRPFLERYGKYILIRHRDLTKADRWFAKYGDEAVFLTRLLPVVRTFISFPAGVARVEIKRFMIYTFAGSLLWSALLTFIGMKLGEHYEDIKPFFHMFDVVIAIILIVGVAWYVRRHLRSSRG